MKFPWANSLLLALVVVELASGIIGLVAGAPEKAIFIQAHRAAGYGILLLLIWKGGNILFSLRKPMRKRRAPAPRTASLVLLATLLLTLALGLVWSVAGPFVFASFSGMSWHIYVGAALAPVLVWHSAYQTRGLPLTFWADRRSFLRLTGLAVAGLALWQLGELGARLAGLKGPTRRFTGSYESVREAGSFPVVSWLNDNPPPVDPARWMLSIGGAVENEYALGLQDLTSHEEITATIDCTGGWYSSQVWRGVPVARLLERAAPTSGAASVTVTSVTGYYRRFSLDEAHRYILASHVGGRELSHGHGYPVRLVAPGKRGFEWVKWVATIEVNESSKWLQPPLPLQ